ncbi:MAG TPA: carbohydrate porin [Candidatus Methylomirabilis sp.]|nr:carbohydrate porin [Candidatus Methylomirabilis sp.]
MLTASRTIGFFAATLCSLWILPACAASAASDATDDVAAPARHPLISETPSAFQWSLHLDSEAVSDRDGGLRRGTVSDTVAHAAMAMDTQPLGLWAGGRFAASALHIRSGEPSRNYVGSLQAVSNIEAEPATRLFQLWYRQQFDWSESQLKAGLIDMNQDFMAVDSAGMLLNGSFGVMPTLSADVLASIYPEPGFGIEAAAVRGRWQFQLGLFQPDPTDRGSLFQHGQLLIGEVAYERMAGEESWGHYKFGVWQYRQTDPDLVHFPRDDAGIYGIVDQTLLRHGARELAVFLQGGASPDAANPVPYYVGAGLQLQAPFHARPRDLFAAGVAHAHIREDDAAAETVYELSYLIHVYRFASLQPDLQYVVHPGGQTDINDALVAIVRLHLEFD